MLVWAGAPSAQAQTTPNCPASLAPVKGGLGDSTTLGLDDGARGGEAAYEPGELIVVLRPGRTAADLRCLADELNAIVVDGGMGRRGLGSLRNAVILQLPAGVSVQRTARLLLDPRYRALILAAHPNRIDEVGREDNARDPTVTDPLFPVQWGLSLAADGQIPITNLDPFTPPFVAGTNIEAAPFTPNQTRGRYGMRVRQAWGLLARKTLAQYPRVRVAVVDDSLVDHPDLRANVADAGNARLTADAAGDVRIDLVESQATGARWRLSDEFGVWRELCNLEWDMADPAKQPNLRWIAGMIAAQVGKARPGACDRTKTPTTWRVDLDGAYEGSLSFAYEGRSTAAIDLAPLYEMPTDPQTGLPDAVAQEATIERLEAQIEAAIEGVAVDANGTRPLVVAAIRREEQWYPGEDSRLRQLRIVLYDRPGQLSVDSSRLVANPIRVAGRISQDAAEGVFQAGIAFGRGGTFSLSYRLVVQDPAAGVAPVTYDVSTGDLSAKPDADEVATQLDLAARAAGIAPATLSFKATKDPGFSRVFHVRAIRPVADRSWITAEEMRVVPSGAIAPDPVEAELRRYAGGSATLVDVPDGTHSIFVSGLPQVKAITAVSTEKRLRAAVVATESGVEVIPAATAWPGQMDSTASHGQFIAGLIGAEANGVGMVGVIGDQKATRTDIRINGLVTNLSSVGSVNLLDYLTRRLDPQVANLSWGTKYKVAGKDLDLATDAQLRKEDPLDASVTQMQIALAPDANRTLFVVAAGNEGGDVRRPAASLPVLRKRAADDAEEALKRRNPQATAVQITKARDAAETAAGIGLNPCRPKGGGVTQRPSGTATKQQEKGGTLSMLRMPDGTFDRGNILCVAASDWNGHLAEFSNWGPGIVDVAAPGVSIVGTRVGDGYSTGNGTSYSAPLVAGIAAMVYSVVPDAQPWLVKCAILSSATTRPLRVDVTKRPYKGLTVTEFDPIDMENKTVIPYKGGKPLTVSGVVQASEAISAALHLDARVKRKLAGGWGSWPTCVQKRGFFGGWRNTSTG